MGLGLSLCLSLSLPRAPRSRLARRDNRHVCPLLSLALSLSGGAAPTGDAAQNSGRIAPTSALRTPRFAHPYLQTRRSAAPARPRTFASAPIRLKESDQRDAHAPRPHAATSVRRPLPQRTFLHARSKKERSEDGHLRAPARRRAHGRGRAAPPVALHLVAAGPGALARARRGLGCRREGSKWCCARHHNEGQESSPTPPPTTPRSCTPDRLNCLVFIPAHLARSPSRRPRNPDARTTRWSARRPSRRAGRRTRTTRATPATPTRRRAASMAACAASATCCRWVRAFLVVVAFFDRAERATRRRMCDVRAPQKKHSRSASLSLSLNKTTTTPTTHRAPARASASSGTAASTSSRARAWRARSTACPSRRSSSSSCRKSSTLEKARAGYALAAHAAAAPPSSSLLPHHPLTARPLTARRLCTTQRTHRLR